MNRRLGRFSIPRNFVFDFPEDTKKIMAECLILRCEFLVSSDCFEYEACCDLFDELPLGQVLPTYQFSIDQDKALKVEKL